MDDTLKRYMKEMVSKSCGTDVDLSLLNNPNLEADRFTQELHHEAYESFYSS